MAKKQTKLSFWHPASLISTLFGIGKIPFMSGTWGSIAVLGDWIVLNYLITRFSLSPILFSLIWIGICAFSFWIGLISINHYLKYSKNKDPSEIIMDEAVGMIIGMVTTSMLLLAFNIQTVSLIGLKFILVSLALFRAFDILKPSIIGHIDRNMEGGMGVIMDDVFAGVFSGVITFVILILT